MLFTLEEVKEFIIKNDLTVTDSLTLALVPNIKSDLKISEGGVIYTESTYTNLASEISKPVYAPRNKLDNLTIFKKYE